ncbi:MAG: twin-arginine translocase TatA/TatE family subunit [Alphaproteobacteria bacterium]|nr:twin-arginine translocase TatA/TatE family subunit [Alphaproteobacteria bacterium]
MTISVWNIIIIAALIFLLFGSQKFPSMMRNLAEGIKIFKSEIGGDKKKPTKTEEAKKPAAKKKAPAKKKVAVKKK